MNYKGWIVVASLLFGIGIALGLTAPASIAGPVTEDLAALEHLASMLAPFSALTAIFIFIKNASAFIISFIFSPVLCLSPILSLTVNGWLLGFISPVVVSEKSLGYLLAGVLPHGIFEIPALIICGAASLDFGTVAIVSLFKKEKRQSLLPVLKHNLRFLAVALALLVPAAIVETYATPLLLGQ